MEFYASKLKIYIQNYRKKTPNLISVFRLQVAFWACSSQKERRKADELSTETDFVSCVLAINV